MKVVYDNEGTVSGFIDVEGDRTVEFVYNLDPADVRLQRIRTDNKPFKVQGEAPFRRLLRDGVIVALEGGVAGPPDDGEVPAWSASTLRPEWSEAAAPSGASVLSTLFTNLDSNQASPSQGDPLIWDQPADLLVGADAAVNATNANIIDILTDGVYVVSLELVYQCSTDAEGRLQVRSSFNIADGDSLWGWINGREVVGVIHPTATGSSGDKYNYTWTLAPSALQAGDTLAFEVWPFLGAGTVTVTNDSGLSVVRIADLPLV